MKFIEEKYLDSIKIKINKYEHLHQDNISFFNDIMSFDVGSIQKESFKGDLEFLNDVGFILSVIISIINHPHMINKGEEIVTRSELAKELTTDMLQRTIRDSKLWSESDDLEYVPEYVYYFQQIDELKIYENIFIVVLINKIALELNKYNDFYTSLIEEFDSNSKCLINGSSLKAIEKIEALLRKLKHIKQTYFYKSINKGLKPMSFFQPTNILIKDRLYNFCYKFYKKIISFEDSELIAETIDKYYYYLFLKALKNNDFELNSKDVNTFNNNNFTIKINKIINNRLEVFVTCLKSKIKAKYLVILSLENSYLEINNLEVDYDQVFVVSPYRLSTCLDSYKFINSNPLDEYEILLMLVREMTALVEADAIYYNYCPICKAKSIDETDGISKCEACNSRYSIFKLNRKNYIWLISRRR